MRTEGRTLRLPPQGLRPRYPCCGPDSDGTLARDIESARTYRVMPPGVEVFAGFLVPFASRDFGT